MANPTPEPARGGPPKKLLVGCGAGCSLVMLALLVVLGMGLQKMKATTRFVTEFATAGAGGDLDKAYAQLGSEAQRANTAEQFKLKWMLTRTALGTLQKVESGGSPRPDYKTGTYTVPVRLVGDKARIDLKVTVNPNDKPLKVLAFTLAQEP